MTGESAPAAALIGLAVAAIILLTLIIILGIATIIMLLKYGMQNILHVGVIQALSIDPASMFPSIQWESSTTDGTELYTILHACTDAFMH